MGLYLHFAAEDGLPVGSNRGWSDLIAWVETLQNTPALAHLCQYGWCQELPKLTMEVGLALKKHPPIRPDVFDTVRNLSNMLASRPQDAETCSVSNGMRDVPDDGSGEEGDDEVVGGEEDDEYEDPDDPG